MKLWLTVVLTVNQVTHTASILANNEQSLITSPFFCEINFLTQHILQGPVTSSSYISLEYSIVLMLLLREWETNLWGENSDIQLRSNQRLLNASQTLLPLSLVLNFHHHAPLVIATRTVLLGGLCVPFVPLNKGCSESVRISWNWLRPLGNVACLLLLCLLLHTVDNIKFCFATVLLSPLELHYLC